MDRVSTLNLHNMTVSSALNLQSQLATAQTQQASGLASQDFGGLGGYASQQTLNLENEISQAQTWAGEAQTMGGRTQAMYDAVGNLTKLITSLQSNISQALGSVDVSSMQGTTQSLLKSVLTQMNLQSGGRYLFSGSTIATTPIDLSQYPSKINLPAGQVDTSYYAGDQNVLSVRVSSQQTIGYGVTGDNKAFAETLQALQTVIQGTSAVSLGATTYASPTAALGYSSSTFSINGVTLSAPPILPTDSLQGIADKINTACGSAGVTARVVQDAGTGLYQLQVASATSNLTVANDPGLGLSSTALPSRSQINSALSQALTTANQAMKDMSNLQGSVAAVSKQLSDAQTQQTNFVTFLENSLSNFKDVDAAKTASEVQLLQTQLQSSYMAVASVTKISLAQYL